MRTSLSTLFILAVHGVHVEHFNMKKEEFDG